MNIIILIGLPGSGKSTWRNDFIEENQDYKIFSTDDMLEDLAKSLNKTYNEVFDFTLMKSLEKTMFKQFEESISKKENIIVDRTNMNFKSRKRFLSLVPDDYIKIAHVFMIDDEELGKRLLQRPGKNIPNDVICSMKSAFQMPTLEEFDHVFIHDDQNSYCL